MLTVEEIEIIEKALKGYENSVEHGGAMLEGLQGMASKVFNRMEDSEKTEASAGLDEMRNAVRDMKELPEKIVRLRVKILGMKEDLILQGATAKL